MTVKQLGIVGSGIMGAGIAETAARAGIDVVLRSRRQETADATLAGLERSLAKQVDKGKLSPPDRDAITAAVRATSDLAELAGVDLVIESVVEELDAKKHLFRELDRLLVPTAIIATNTSTLPVIELAMETNRPELVCGIHFFNPAPTMSARRNRPAAHRQRRDHPSTAKAFATICGKEPVEVKDQAGLHRQPSAVPLFEQRRPAARAGRRQPGRHRHRHAGRMQFPDGPVFRP